MSSKTPMAQDWSKTVWDALGHNGTLQTKRDFGNQDNGSVLNLEGRFGTLGPESRNRGSTPELRWHRN